MRLSSWLSQRCWKGDLVFTSYATQCCFKLSATKMGLLCVLKCPRMDGPPSWKHGTELQQAWAEEGAIGRFHWRRWWFEFVVWNPFPHRCTFTSLGFLTLTHSFKQYLLSTNYGPDFVDIKPIRHKIPSRFQAQSHGDDFSNLTCIEHLLYTRHCSRCFAGVYNLFLPTTQKGAFNIPILPTRKSRHGEDY